MSLGLFSPARPLKAPLPSTLKNDTFDRLWWVELMRRSTVNWILVGYLLVAWTAIVVRCDRFPLTWVPMYSTFLPSEISTVRLFNKELMAKGLRVTHRDGSTSDISKDDLNIPKPNFRRLYNERMFGAGPAKHRQGNMNLGSFNRRLRGLAEGEPNFSALWDRRILWSLNKTLGYEPRDPRFIVRAESQVTERHYLKKDLLKQDFSNATVQEHRASIEWKEEWATWWEDGPF